MFGSSRRLLPGDLSGEIENVREQTLTGVKWLTYSRGGLQIAAILSTVVLARLIAPAEYGRAAVALAVFQIGGVIGYEGFGSAVVQRATIDRRYLQATSFLSLSGGVLLSIVCAAGLYPLLAVLIDQRTAALTLLICVSFVASAASTVPKSVLRRRLDFRQLAINEVFIAVTMIVVSIGLAVAGLNAEALVLAGVASSVVGAVLAFVVAPGAMPIPHREPLRDLLGFALSVQASGILYSVQRFGAVPLVAASLGAASAGFFQRAYALGMEYQGKVSSIMLTVAFPLYSRMGDLERARAMRRRVVRVHATVLFPFLLMVAALAPILVPLVYGERWLPAADPTTILAVTGLAAAILTGTGPLVMAAGRPDALLRYHLVATAVLPVVLVVGASFGLIELCLAYGGYHVVNLIAAQYFLLGRTCGVPFRELFDDTHAALVAGAALFGAAKGVSVALESAGLPAAANVLVAAVCGMVTYLAVLRLGFPESWRDFYLLVDRVTGIDRLVARGRRRVAEHGNTP